MNETEVPKANLVQRFFSDVDWKKLLAAAAIGAAGGTAYSIFDQTILHRKNKNDKLPLDTTTLQKLAPDILQALEKFYQYRNNVTRPEYKPEFCRLTAELMRQSEYIAALYCESMSRASLITPDMDIISRCNQLKAHVRVVVDVLRTMLALVQKEDGEEDFNLIDAFNRLYACYNNRLFTMEKSFRA